MVADGLEDDVRGSGVTKKLGDSLNDINLAEFYDKLRKLEDKLDAEPFREGPIEDRHYNTIYNA